MRAAIALVLTLGLLAACGGGGGGDSAPVDSGAPGVLRALALEGEVAPDTGGGTYAAFPTFPIMDAAENGWCAFVANVTGGTT